MHHSFDLECDIIPAFRDFIQNIFKFTELDTTEGSCLRNAKIKILSGFIDSFVSNETD